MSKFKENQHFEGISVWGCVYLEIWPFQIGPLRGRVCRTRPHRASPLWGRTPSATPSKRTRSIWPSPAHVNSSHKFASNCIKFHWNSERGTSYPWKWLNVVVDCSLFGCLRETRRLRQDVRLFVPYIGCVCDTSGLRQDIRLAAPYILFDFATQERWGAFWSYQKVKQQRPAPNVVIIQTVWHEYDCSASYIICPLPRSISHRFGSTPGKARRRSRLTKKPLIWHPLPTSIQHNIFPTRCASQLSTWSWCLRRAPYQ